MPATVNDWTVDMLDVLPDDGQRYEIIDGELFVTPGPGEPHQDIAGELFTRLREHLKGHGVGKAMIAPADVTRGDHTRNRGQPDVFVVRVTDGKRPAYPTNCTIFCWPSRSYRRAIRYSTIRSDRVRRFTRRAHVVPSPARG